MNVKNRYYFRSRIREAKFRQLIRCFALDFTATSTAQLTDISTVAVSASPSGCPPAKVLRACAVCHLTFVCSITTWGTRAWATEQSFSGRMAARFVISAGFAPWPLRFSCFRHTNNPHFRWASSRIPDNLSCSFWARYRYRIWIQIFIWTWGQLWWALCCGDPWTLVRRWTELFSEAKLWSSPHLCYPSSCGTLRIVSSPLTPQYRSPHNSSPISSLSTKLFLPAWLTFCPYTSTPPHARRHCRPSERGGSGKLLYQLMICWSFYDSYNSQSLW